MKTNKVVGGALAAMLAVGVSTAAFAQSNDREANLQAMRWHAQQQMAQGLPNPYPGVNLNTGAGFFEMQRNAALWPNYAWGNQWNNSWNNSWNNRWANPYGYNYNPYYGYNTNSGWWF
jgi:hypothetical protein